MRRLLKLAVFVVAVVIVGPFIVLACLEGRLTGGELLFSAFAQLLALVPSRVGTLLRGAYYFGTLRKCSWETHVGFGSLFTHRGGAMGQNVSMGAYCIIGHADIEAGVMMGSRVSIPSGKRQHFDDAGQISSETRFDTVRIGCKCWIGEGAIILADVGSGCIVSAGAVVIKVVPDRCIVGGNPAQVIKELA
ncbi:MAG TPA: acyltransferase [Steroidobacteraceae bacterium]|nr:acyltransferase [Steroidobacteraceae bacterium]